MSDLASQGEGPTTWSSDWLKTSAKRRVMSAWRGVEAQHLVSTMRLVNSLAEQDVLEQLLEAGKPAAPAHPSGQHYLLYSPFRYRAPFPSRFRATGAQGVWYGAATVETVCAEVAYWRWRFIMDSAGLISQELSTEHTLYRAEIDGVALDLTQPPWVDFRSVWTAPNDYSGTQRVSTDAADAGIDWIKYESVRNPGGECAAVLTPAVLTMSTGTGKQTWHCKASRTHVMMRYEDQGFEWSF